MFILFLNFYRTIKDDDYEEILDVNDRLSQRLQSGAVVNKMKDRMYILLFH